MSRKRSIVFAVAVLAAGAILAATFSLAPWRSPPLSFEAVRARWQPSYAYLLDRDGALLQAQRVNFASLRDDWVSLRDISPAFLDTVIRAEDQRFRRHSGVDAIALAAALKQYAQGGRRGASTITMQLASLLDPQRLRSAGHRGLRAKLAQLQSAWAIERSWTKGQILEAYLNLVAFRGELQGIGAAARSLYGKHPSGLDEMESLLLATLISSPNAPPERLAARVCALAAARDCAPLVAATATALARARQAQPSADAMGTAPQLAQSLLRTAGERVQTTLSASLQLRVRDILARRLVSLRGENVRDGAAVVLDNASGEVLAYVGSAGPYSTAGNVDGARALRQAGSTLKPFLYGLAFERRYITPASLLDDSPVNLETASGLYIPQNYDRDFKGVVSARTALASSLNIPAVRTLVLVGVESFRDQLNAVGYENITQDGEFYGYSLALGSAEVSLLQQVNAYRTLANGGVWSPAVVRSGNAGEIRTRRVLSQAAAFLVAEALSDSAARSVTFGLDSALATPFWSAVKTGTSKDLRDNWCIGYSQRYTVAVWVGNFEGDSMHEVSGVTGAAPVWLEVMQGLHANRSADRGAFVPAIPSGITARSIQFVPAVEPARRAYFLSGTESSRIEQLQAGNAVPRIVSPANGAVIALDPDIPQHNQQVVFQSRAAEPALRFFLDGRFVGAPAVQPRWTPLPGTHRLELRSADGRVQDIVRFTVRPAT